ncbi:MAG: phosphoribosyltransferase [Candidatus Saccharimonadales bacterium]
MYFHSRTEAGEKLADQLVQYRYENSVVVALNEGSLAVGEPIATRLHCALSLFLTEEVQIPGEQTALGTVNQGGGFIYNRSLSPGEIDDYYSEFHTYIEDQKREKFEKINRLLGDGGILDISLLREHVVILVADGLKTGAVLDATAEFLKPIKIKRLVIATPVASVQAVDRMHILADELHCLSVTENYLATDHYYDANDVPTREEAVQKINNIVLNWQ